MNEKIGSHHVVDFPAERRSMVAFQELKSGKHCMYALLEVDVTIARKFIEDCKEKTGEQMSFTGYLIYCLACAVDEDKAVQSYRKGSKRLVMFDDVDIGFMIELTKGEKRVLTGRHPGCQPQDLPRDPSGDPLGTIQKRSSDCR